MAGRAKRAAPKRKRPEVPPLDAPQPKPSNLAGPRDHAPALAARAEAAVQQALEAPLKLSHAYQQALSMGARIEDEDDPDAVRHGILVGLKAARGRSGLRVADLVAAALVRRVVDSTTRDAVLAARELADRTEGPVTQRIEAASVRYVVSVGPSGALGPAALAALPAPEWERMARADWDAAQAQPSPSATPEGETHRVNRG